MVVQDVVEVAAALDAIYIHEERPAAERALHALVDAARIPGSVVAPITDEDPRTHVPPIAFDGYYAE